MFCPPISKVMSISDLLLKLENAGEVGVGIAEHKLDKSDAGVTHLTVQSPVAYVLDALKSDRKKKAKKVRSFFCPHV